MTSGILQEAAAGRAIIRPWTVEQYHWAIETRFLEEDTSFELLDGFIVHKDRAKAGEDTMTIGDRHALVVQRLMRLIPQFDALGCHLRVQQPVSLPPYNEPEPDGSVVRGSEDDYASQTPVVSDVSAIIEVADSSLVRDLGAKLHVYANSGIAQYVVVDLVHNVVLDHRQPQGEKYSQVNPLHTGQNLELMTFGGRSLSVAVLRLLP